MSAVVQLSFGIKEKLHIDEPSFSTITTHHKAESKAKPNLTCTPFAPQQNSGEWPVSQIGSTSLSTPAILSSTSNKTKDILSGAAGALFDIPFRRFENQKPFGLRDIKPIALVKTTVPCDDHSQTTVFDLKEHNLQSLKEKSFLPYDTSRPEDGLACNRQRLSIAKNSNWYKFGAISEADEASSFPCIIGQSDTNVFKNLNCYMPSFSVFSGVPPIKKHCRSKQSDFGIADKHDLPSGSWKPSPHSHVWASIGHFHPRCSTESSAGLSRQLCTRSTDSESSTHSKLLPSPLSPIPRPGSVTVIKQEGITHTLSSRHRISGQVRKFNFSPLESSITPPASSELVDISSRSWHSGVTATKRSSSFSDDIEYKESIEYSPPELERRSDSRTRGKLLRCQSHPSDLNLKRGKGRRKARLCYNRPSLDLVKMKQTKYSTYNKLKKHTPLGPKIKFLTIPQSSSPLSPFTFAGSEPFHLEQDQVFPSTSNAPTCAQDLTTADVLGVISANVETPFVRECYDLDVNEIEKESDTEMNAQ